MRQPPPPRVLRGSAPSPEVAPAAPIVEDTPREVTAASPRTNESANVAISMTPRLQERHRAERRASIRKVAIVVGSAILVGALGWTLFFSPAFSLHAESAMIEIHGDGVTEAMVGEVLAAYDGVQLTRLRTSTLETRLTESGGIAEATVDRAWPHSLVVVVTAREPVAAVPSEGGFQLYDVEGVLLNVVAEAPEGLPVISTEIDDDTPVTIGAILSVLGQMPGELLSEITTISATSEQTITFTLADGATVKWGDATENDLKVAVLQTLRQVAANTYDVSAPRSPVTS